MTAWLEEQRRLREAAAVAHELWAVGADHEFRDCPQQKLWLDKVRRILKERVAK